MWDQLPGPWEACEDLRAADAALVPTSRLRTARPDLPGSCLGHVRCIVSKDGQLTRPRKSIRCRVQPGDRARSNRSVACDIPEWGRTR